MQLSQQRKVDGYRRRIPPRPARLSDREQAAYERGQIYGYSQGYAAREKEEAERKP